MRSLDSSKIESTYILPLLKNIYEKSYTQTKQDVSSDIRTSICHTDFVLFKDAVQNDDESGRLGKVLSDD